MRSPNNVPMIWMCRLANGYHKFMDSFGVIHFIAPEAVTVGREQWLWFEVGGEIYIYIEKMY